MSKYTLKTEEQKRRERARRRRRYHEKKKQHQQLGQGHTGGGWNRINATHLVKRFYKDKKTK